MIRVSYHMRSKSSERGGSHMIEIYHMIGGVSYDRPLSCDKGGLI